MRVHDVSQGASIYVSVIFCSYFRFPFHFFIVVSMKGGQELVTVNLIGYLVARVEGSLLSRYSN